MGKRLNPYSVKSRHWLALTFAAALCMALLLFVPFIVYNNGIFFYFGDFNVQEIPFYQLIHGQVRDGTLGWNHLTDLGTDTLASYSFYLMGSPFFWLTIPFPNEFVPYLIGPILILKFACTASSAYLWLQRHVRFKGYAAVGGILYYFCLKVMPQYAAMLIGAGVIVLIRFIAMYKDLNLPKFNDDDYFFE